MTNCPLCQAKLTEEDIASGRCPACNILLVDDDAGASRDEGASDADGPDTTETWNQSIAKTFIPGQMPPLGDPAEAGEAGKSAPAGGVSQEEIETMTGLWSGSIDPNSKDAPVISGQPPDALKTMIASWSGSVDPKTNPMLSLKGNEPKSEAKSALPVRTRALAVREGIEPPDSDYELLEVLGEGGMGVVYTARQMSIDRTVAVKMIKTSQIADDAREKFLSEAVVTGDLDHPNIVPIYDLGSNDSGALFYSMKRVEGTPWLDVVKTKSLQENVEILMKVADAVAFAHSRGVVHRDLKPENVMLGEYGEVLVMDWGLALPSSDFLNSHRIAQTTGMGGTPAYMAPEMAAGPVNRISCPSDIYLLGAILYEVVTGRPPHSGKNAMQCLFAAMKNEIVPTEKKGELVDIALRAMATKPEDRYASVRSFQEHIREYLSHTESIALSSRAEEELIKAKKSNEYQDFQQALFGFKEAYELWDGNKRAQKGISEAQLAYAGSALAKGDYDLGESLLDSGEPAHAEVLKKIKAAQKERDARTQRLKMAKRLVAALLLVVFGGGAIATYLINAQRKQAVIARNEAVKQEGIAKEQTKIAEEQRGIAFVQKEKAEVARNEAVVAQKEAEEQRQIADQRREEAVVAQKEAERQKGIADEQKMIANDEKEKAVLARNDAIEAKNEADTQRTIAVEQKGIAEQQRGEAEYRAYIAQIGLASAKIDENAFESAVALLKGCRPELRHWEWGRLMHLCGQHQQDYNVAAPVASLAVSPDGKRFVTGEWDGTAKIWDFRSGALLSTLDHGGANVNAVAYSPDGQYIATGSNDPAGYLKLWRVDGNGSYAEVWKAGHAKGKTDEFENEHTEAVLCVKFSHDGQKLLSTSYDKTARLWDVGTGKQLRRYYGHNWWVWDAAFSADDSRIVTAGQDGIAIVWQTETGEQSPPFTGHEGPVYTVAFSPDGASVVSGGYDRRVLIWKPGDVQPYRYDNLASKESIDPGAKYRALDGHTSVVRSVSYSHDGKLILSGGQDHTVKVWDAESGKALKTFRGHDEMVSACAFSMDDKAILSASHDTHVKKWSIVDYEEIRVLRGRLLEGHEDAVLAASFSPDGTRIVTASQDRTARTWSAGSGSADKSFQEGHEFLASSSVFAADGKRMLTAAVDNTTRIWNVTTGTEMQRLPGTGRSAAVALSPDGRWVLTGGDSRPGDDKQNKELKLWDAQLWDLEACLAAEHPRPVRSFVGHHSEVTAVAFHPTQPWVATGDAKGSCRLWDLESGREIRVLKAKGLDKAHVAKIGRIVFLPDGSRMLTASSDRTVAQWDVATGAELAGKALKHPDSIIGLFVAPDGRTVLSACEDRVVRVWDIDHSEAEAGRLATEGRLINAVAVSNDGRFALAADSEKQTVSVFDLKTREVLRTLDLAKKGGLVWTAAFSPDGVNVLTVGGAEAKLWDRETGQLRMSFSPHAAVASADFSPNRKYIITGSWDNAAKIWEVESGKAVMKLEGQHKGKVNSACFSPVDGTVVLTASDDGTAKMWKWNSGANQVDVTRTFEAGTEPLRHAVFSANGAYVLTASDDRTARVWDSGTGKELCVLTGHEGPVLCGVFSSDGTRVATGSEDNTVRVWSWDVSGKVETQLALVGHTAAVTSVAISPDGLRVLTGSRDNTVKLWDTRIAEASARPAAAGDPAAAKANGGAYPLAQEILTLTGHTREVTSVAFSPNGKLVLTGSRDGRAILWLTVDWKDGTAETMTAEGGLDRFQPRRAFTAATR